MLEHRVLCLNQIKTLGGGSVVYWMSRDQRVQDNWALLFARQQAQEKGVELIVIFCIFDKYPEANARHFHFMLGGLEKVETSLRNFNIPFVLLQGNPVDELALFVKKHDISVLITDFDPIRVKRNWKNMLAQKLTIPFFEVDSHNIVPCFKASNKLEYAAYTIRPKIQRLLNLFLIPFPTLEIMTKNTFPLQEKINWAEIYNNLDIDRNVIPVTWLTSGEDEAFNMLQSFINEKLDIYINQRNDPSTNGCSQLSPYLHFGQISAQRIAIEVMKADVLIEAKATFLEELIVRRELSDNYCYYNHQYDSFDGFPPWAKKTLMEHQLDERTHVYRTDEFESASTHDMLWNAAQKQMVTSGKMHGYMRMYWAKKILEWTPSPEEALKIAIYLNDKYSLDGRDPNGYVGCAWSIGGVHDRAWNQHPVYGKIRYMNESGCRRKFDIKKYINRFAG